MKILFLGNFLLAQRIVAVLTSKEIEVSYFTDEKAALEKIKSNEFNMVILDSILANLKAVCDEICRTPLFPVVIMVNQQETNWKLMNCLQADGFVNSDASDAEILARIKALYNRHTIKYKQLSV